MSRTMSKMLPNPPGVGLSSLIDSASRAVQHDPKMPGWGLKPKGEGKRVVAEFAWTGTQVEPIYRRSGTAYRVEGPGMPAGGLQFAIALHPLQSTLIGCIKSVLPKDIAHDPSMQIHFRFFGVHLPEMHIEAIVITD